MRAAIRDAFQSELRQQQQQHLFPSFSPREQGRRGAEGDVVAGGRGWGAGRKGRARGERILGIDAPWALPNSPSYEGADLRRRFRGSANSQDLPEPGGYKQERRKSTRPIRVIRTRTHTRGHHHTHTHQQNCGERESDLYIARALRLLGRRGFGGDLSREGFLFSLSLCLTSAGQGKGKGGEDF